MEEASQADALFLQDLDAAFVPKFSQRRLEPSEVVALFVVAYGKVIEKIAGIVEFQEWLRVDAQAWAFFEDEVQERMEIVPKLLHAYRDGGGLGGVEGDLGVGATRGVKDVTDHILDGNGPAVADVDRITGGMFFQQQQAAPDQVRDMEEIPDFLPRAPNHIGILPRHSPANECGDDVTCFGIEIIMAS